MKKTSNIFITIVLSISMILYGKAQTITVDDLVKRINKVGSEIQFNNNDSPGKINFKDQCNAKYENSIITLTCTAVDEETEETHKTELNVSVDNSVLIYKGDYKLNDQQVNKDSIDYLGQTLTEALCFGVILENLSILKGYSLEDYKKIENDQVIVDKLKKMSLNEMFNNLGFYYDTASDADPIFKIDINRFNLPIESNNTNSSEQLPVSSKEEATTDIQSSSKKATVQNNPHTAVAASQILIGGLFILLLGIITIIRKKNFFESI